MLILKLWFRVWHNHILFEFYFLHNMIYLSICLFFVVFFFVVLSIMFCFFPHIMHWVPLFILIHVFVHKDHKFVVVSLQILLIFAVWPFIQFFFVYLISIFFSDQGSNPTWNQKFEFHVDDGITELLLEVMDEDSGTADDELGLVTYVSFVFIFFLFNLVNNNFYSYFSTQSYCFLIFSFKCLCQFVHYFISKSIVFLDKLNDTVFCFFQSLFLRTKIFLIWNVSMWLWLKNVMFSS